MGLSSSEKLSSSTATDLDGRTLIGGVASGVSLPVETSTSRTIKYVAISAASSGNNTVLAAVPAKKITVISYSLVADGAVTAKFTDATLGDLTGAMSFAANGGIVDKGEINAPLWQGTTNTALVINLGGAVGVRGRMTYYEA